MTEAQRKALKRCIDILENDAEELKDCFYSRGQWEATGPQDDYKERKKLAKELRVMLEGK